MKVYTKSGDKGETSLVGGKRVPKHDIRIEAYGTIDELMGHIGHIHSLADDKDDQGLWLDILDRLMTCASIMATDKEFSKENIPAIYESDIQLLENKIDEIDKLVDELNSFVLPGGHPVISNCHIARSVCRRAERECWRANEKMEVNILVLKYLNRLSDFLFMFARKMAYKLNVEEIKWKPKL